MYESLKEALVQICFFWHSQLLPLNLCAERCLHLNFYNSILALGETASINVTLSSRSIQNGTSMNLTAAFDPTVGSGLLSDVSCRYINPGESGYIAITKYNTRKTEIIFDAGLSSSQRSRMSITSSGNATILTISNIIFSDEKTSYYCHLAYYDSDDNLLSMNSNTQILENVYSE